MRLCAAGAGLMGFAVGCLVRGWLQSWIENDADDCMRSFASDRSRRIQEASARWRRRSVRVLLIRHAQSESNLAKDHCHNGRHISVPLSELGRRQAKVLGRQLSRENVSRVFCSEALRTQETAALACAELSLAALKIEVITTREAAPRMGICEVAMGGWTGLDKKTVNTPDIKKAREVDAWEWRPDGVCAEEGLEGESYRMVEERFMQFLEEIVLSSNGFEDGAATPSHHSSSFKSQLTGIMSSLAGVANEMELPCVAVFSHHAAIRCVLRAITESSPRILAPKLSPANTSITEIKYDARSTGRAGGWSVIRVNDAGHLEGLN